MHMCVCALFPRAAVINHRCTRGRPSAAAEARPICSLHSLRLPANSRQLTYLLHLLQNIYDILSLCGARAPTQEPHEVRHKWQRRSLTPLVKIQAFNDASNDLAKLCEEEYSSVLDLVRPGTVEPFIF